MRFSVLGELEVSVDGRRIDLGRPLQKALLAFLILELNRPVSLATIVDLLWDNDSGPADPRAAVQTYVARLRRALATPPAGVDNSAGTAPAVAGDNSTNATDAAASPEPAIERTGAGYRLCAPAESVDVEEFCALADQAREALRARRPAEALAAAERALGLWRGPAAAPELAERRPAQPHLVRLAEAHQACAEDRAEALVGLGRWAEAIATLDQLISAHPLRERCWLLAMRALSGAGRSAEALDRYQQLRQLLDAELGLEPGAALRALHLQILRGETAPTPKAERPPTVAPELVGRNDELAGLEAILAAGPESGPTFALIDGEPGIGKTALARELGAIAAARGIAVAWGRCHEDDDRPALWPWRQVLTALGSGRPSTDQAGPTALAGTFETFETVLADLRRAARRTPLLVVLDDVQWADPASLRLVNFLAVELDDAPITVVATCRPDPSAELRRARAVLARRTGFRWCRLGPLDSASTTELIRRRIGTVDDAQAVAVHRRSGGNPFFAGELAALLTGPHSVEGLPSAVIDAIERRLTVLSEGSRRTLELAAVLGERFGLDRILECSGSDRDRAADDLDSAVAAGLLHAEGLDLRFDHALIRETVLAGCSDIRQRRLHTQIAVAAADPVDRAFHLWAGRPFTDPHEVVAACGRAAELAERDSAHESAAQWWQRALEVLAHAGPTGDSDGSVRRIMTLQLAAALARGGHTVQAQEVLAELLEHCLDVGAIQTAVQAAAVLTASGGAWVWVQWNSDPRRLVASLDRLLTALPEGPHRDRVRVLATMALGHTYLAPPRMGELVDQAVTLARASGDDDVLAEALTAWTFGHWGPTTGSELIAVGREAIRTADRAGRAELAAMTRLRLAIALTTMADPDAALETVAKVRSWATEARQPMFTAQLEQLEGTLYALRGDFDAARDHVELADRAMERSGYHLRELITSSSLAFHAVEQGRVNEFVAGLPQRSAEHGDFLLFGYGYLDAGDRARALAAIEERDGWAAQPRWWNWSALACWQADLAAALAESVDPAVLARMADDLAPLSGTVGCWGGLGTAGPVDRYLGQLLVALDRSDEARAAFERALTLSRELGLRPAEAAVSVGLADLVDDNRRQELRERAAALADQLDLRRVSRRLAGLPR